MLEIRFTRNRQGDQFEVRGSKLEAACIQWIPLPKKRLLVRPLGMPSLKSTV